MNNLSFSLVPVHQAGVIFDVDGVLVRGSAVIPAARRAFRKLLDSNNNFLFPTVFVTNAGSCQRHHKAQQLSHLLGVQVGGCRTSCFDSSCVGAVYRSII